VRLIINLTEKNHEGESKRGFASLIKPDSPSPLKERGIKGER